MAKMSDSPKYQTARAPSVERRQHPRRRVESLIYVGFGDDNGGIVLDLSEGGMGFHAAIALHQFHFPKVRFQLPVSGNWAEAAGDIAWMNEPGTMAGLKFTSLPEEARAEIREWVGGKASVTRPVAAQPADEIGQAPRYPRVSPSPRVAAPVAEPEVEEPVPTPDQSIEQPLAPPISLEADQNQVAAPVAPEEETRDEVLQSQASALPPRADVTNEQPEIPVVIARSVEFAEVAEGSPLDAAARNDAEAEMVVSRNSFANSTVEEERDAASSAEEDEIVAAAIAHAPVAMEKPADRISSGIFGETSLGVSKGNFADATAGSFDWERSHSHAPEKKFSAWALAAMFLGTTAISFAAGWAVGHGLLNTWIHTSADAPPTKTGPAVQAPPAITGTPSTSTSVVTQPQPQTQVAGPSSGGAATPPASTTAVAAVQQTPEHAAPMDVPTPTGQESSTVELPDEPIGASSTVAMSATRSVEIPAASGAGTRPGSAHVQPGDLVSHVQPDYPVETMQEQVEGTVKLRVTVGKDGNIRQIEPMGGPPALVGTSVAAVQQWRYKPTYVNGKPVEVQEIVRIEFRLPPSSGAPATNP